jgi:hypothetical protein
MVLEFAAAPVVLDAWLFGLLLVALVCPLLGVVEEPAPASEVKVGAAEALDVEAAALPLGVLPALLASAGLLLLLDDPAPEPEPDPAPEEAPLIVNCSFTCFTPAIDLATSLARFLSAFDATLPVIIAVPFVTDTCTFAKAGS